MEIKEAIGLGIVLGATTHTLKKLAPKKKRKTKRRKKK